MADSQASPAGFPNAHSPFLCEVADPYLCDSCATWQHGREFGKFETILDFKYFDSDEHFEGECAPCGVCDTVYQLESEFSHEEYIGMKGPSRPERLKVVIAATHFEVKPKVRVRTTPAIRVRLEQDGRRLDCGIEFEPTPSSGGRCRACRRERRFA